MNTINITPAGKAIGLTEDRAIDRLMDGFKAFAQKMGSAYLITLRNEETIVVKDIRYTIKPFIYEFIVEMKHTYADGTPDTEVLAQCFCDMSDT